MQKQYYVNRINYQERVNLICKLCASCSIPATLVRMICDLYMICYRDLFRILSKFARILLRLFVKSV